MRTAIIFGVTGQDGAYLTRHLIARDYRVIGVKRRTSIDNTTRLKPHPNLELIYGDVLDPISCVCALKKAISLPILEDYGPIEIYNLACQSHVGVSFELPSYTFQVASQGALNIFEAVTEFPFQDCRIYQASSSEMYGEYNYPLKSENDEMRPVSPYGVGKLAAHHLARIYREAYGLWISCGILFNHESPLRGSHFVTQKIVEHAIAWKHGHGDYEPLNLGNIHAKRDWGHARDYVSAMHLMLQQDKPDDFVIGTGEVASVRWFLEEVWRTIGYTLIWYDSRTRAAIKEYPKQPIVIADSYEYKRPIDIDYLCADAAKARRVLGWKPTTSTTELIHEMLEAAEARYDRVH